MITAPDEAAHNIFALNFGKHFIGCDHYFYDLDEKLMVELGGKIVDDQRVSYSTTILKEYTQEFFFKTCRWCDQLQGEHRPILMKDLQERLKTFVETFVVCCPKVFKIQEESQQPPKKSMYLNFLKRSLTHPLAPL